MLVLGIETSCDETSAAIVENGLTILSCEVSSSLKLHQKYGGIIPEIASRMQLETISQVSDSAIRSAGISRKKIDLVSVTAHPGLLGSLLVGISFAKAVSFGLKIPILGVNHLYSHIYANFLETKTQTQAKQTPSLPFIALIVSGGHTSLFYVRDFNRITVLGQTQDDACGEAFDKVAKILGLKYPGGPLIEKLAKKGNPSKIRFNCSDTIEPLNFSFSGIKTAVLYCVKDELKKQKRLPIKLKSNIAASFQEAVFQALIRKSILACKNKKINQLVIGGGVAANSALRERFDAAGYANQIKVYFPSKALSIDNAAMVAGLGYQLFKKGYSSNLNLSADLSR